MQYIYIVIIGPVLTVKPKTGDNISIIIIIIILWLVQTII